MLLGFATGNGTGTYGTGSTFASLASTYDYAYDASVLVSFVSAASEASAFADETKSIGSAGETFASLGGSADSTALN